MVDADNKLGKGRYVSIQGQGHFLTLARCHLHTCIKIKTCFSQKPIGHFYPKLGTKQCFFIKMMWSHDLDGKQVHIW